MCTCAGTPWDGQFVFFFENSNAYMISKTFSSNSRKVHSGTVNDKKNPFCQYDRIRTSR